MSQKPTENPQMNDIFWLQALCVCGTFQILHSKNFRPWPCIPCARVVIHKPHALYVCNACARQQIIRRYDFIFRWNFVSQYLARSECSNALHVACHSCTTHKIWYKITILNSMHNLVPRCCKWLLLFEVAELKTPGGVAHYNTWGIRPYTTGPASDGVRVT